MSRLAGSITILFAVFALTLGGCSENGSAPNARGPIIMGPPTEAPAAAFASPGEDTDGTQPQVINVSNTKKPETATQ